MKILNAPNIITLTRIMLVPVFLIAVPESGDYGWTPVIVFAAASLTDGLDGMIARKYNLVTTFGKFIDPLADKLLVTAALLVFASRGEMPVWAAMTVLAREFIVTSLRMVAAGQGDIMAAALPGKIKTVVQIACILFMLLPLSGAGSLFYDIAVWLMVAVTVWSGADYLWRGRKLLTKQQ